ncbi:hypothetical protein M3Y99_01392200 [Aphelenchoides fujianensis]|nr:hypothetical protein M3Y99_01392200 [Aphelenchoides fujianensis]
MRFKLVFLLLFALAVEWAAADHSQRYWNDYCNRQPNCRAMIERHKEHARREGFAKGREEGAKNPVWYMHVACGVVATLIGICVLGAITDLCHSKCAKKKPQRDENNNERPATPEFRRRLVEPPTAPPPPYHDVHFHPMERQGNAEDGRVYWNSPPVHPPTNPAFGRGTVGDRVRQLESGRSGKF